MHRIFRSTLYLSAAAFSGTMLHAQAAPPAPTQTPDVSVQTKLQTHETVTVTATSTLITETPTAQTTTTVGRDDFKNTPAITIGDVLSLTPGVSVVSGNGPRDVSISIRGSNERQTFGVRNAQLFEDGFPVTQPDGTGRMDLTDPHAYAGIDVVQGPSSALYGNYAIGGAINFHTRTGASLHPAGSKGTEVGADFGSFGYANDYGTLGFANDRAQVSAFLSNVRATGATGHTAYDTVTVNTLATVALNPTNRLTFKFIDNELDAQLSIRLSLQQYLQNPYQRGCVTSVAVGCGSVSLFTNGFNGTKQSLTADQAGLGRHDRRTIFGARIDHDLTPNTLWSSQFTIDYRDINQPTSALSFRGTYPSFNATSGITRRGLLMHREATSYAGVFYNSERISSYTYNVIPGGNATLGGQTQTVFGTQTNAGIHLRQELALGERWTVVAGIGGELTRLTAIANNFAYPTTGSPTATPIQGDRTFLNVAPEAALQYHPKDALKLHLRFGSGYGTPQATQLFVNAQGLNGNNTTLKTQRNYGVDLGAEFTLGHTLEATVTGFYEWFRNEMVTQSPGVNLQSYTFNAPASAHRGVEAGLTWHPLPQLAGLRIRGSYLRDDQVYTQYSEQITTGTITKSFDRTGLHIPGVTPNFANGRVIYEQGSGRMRGFGVFVETNWRDTYVLDNANLLKAPGSTLLNLSAWYDPPAAHGMLSRLHFYYDMQNLADRTTVATAGNLTDSLDASGNLNPASVLATATGSMYAGTPRASYGGVRVRF